MNRLDNYNRKINFIIEKIHNLPENPLKNEFFLDALFYRIQNAADAAMDIIAMLCKDLGIMVKDDYSNIESLESLDLFNSKMRDDLTRLNGLRNALVHKYNKIDTELVISKREEIVKILEEFIDKVEKVINEKFQKSG
jgi:uncharacterized protein YutE (UPF0331/DUF86 family)